MHIDRQNSIKLRVVETSRFFWRRFKPSLQSNYAFMKIFWLFFPDISTHLEVKSVDWNISYLQFLFTDIKNNETLEIKYRKQEWERCKWKFCTDNLCTSVHYNIQNKNFLRFLIWFSTKWKDLNLESFLNVLAKDFKAKKDYYQIFFKAERPPFSVIQDWSHPLQEFRFIVNEAFTRNTDQSINLNLPQVNIHHSERECQWISPNNKATWYHFFNFPKWYYEDDNGKKGKDAFDKYYYLSEEEKEQYIWELWKRSGSLSISTDLDENDVVMWWGNDKLNQAIDIAIKYAQENDIKLVSFNCCCVPRVVWDDVHSTLLHAREKMDIPFLFKWQFEKTPYEQKVFLLEKYLEKIDETKIDKKAKSISIFWFQENVYQKDLVNVLEQNGIRVNASFIPSIDVRLLENMCKSELFVFSPNTLQKEAFEYPFQLIWVPFITPVYPAWVKNSLTWLDEITQKFQISLQLGESTQKNIDSFHDLVKKVESKKFSAWIVFLWIPELKRFFNPDYTNNIDIVRFLEEMWFKIHFFVFDNFKPYELNRDDTFRESDGNHDMIESLVRSKLPNPDVYTLQYFWEKEELTQKIQESDVNILYSDLYFDKRIIDLWLAQFNQRNFYVGFAGALKTIQELVALCELPFYKHFHTYFKK